MRGLTGLSIALTVSLAAAVVSASVTRISIDGVDGIVRNDSAEAGATISFHLRYTNQSDSGFNITNGFVVYSPEGATWTDSASGNFRGSNLGPIGIDTTGLLSKAQFPTVFALRTFSSAGTIAKADGISPDTVTLSGAGSEVGMGLPPHFDARVFTIKVRTNQSDTNKTICLDSTMRYPSTNRWKWAVLYGGTPADSVFPTWSGARCIRVVSKVWEPIRFTLNGCLTTITSNHCNAFSFKFEAYIPNGVPADVHYRLVSGPGTIDSLTGAWSGGLLAPGSYSVTVRATNIHNGAYVECITGIQSTNVRPLYSASSYNVAVSVGKQTTFTPTVTGGDCDVLTYTLLSSGGADGPVSINSATGALTFTPTSVDSAHGTTTMVVMVADALSSDTASVVWGIVGGCSGVVGNVDCDRYESVDIVDLTVLIDYLFFGFGPLCSPAEANCNGDSRGRIDISDLTKLIDHLFMSFSPLPLCP